MYIMILALREPATSVWTNFFFEKMNIFPLISSIFDYKWFNFSFVSIQYDFAITITMLLLVIEVTKCASHSSFVFFFLFRSFYLLFLFKSMGMKTMRIFFSLVRFSSIFANNFYLVLFSFADVKEEKSRKLKGRLSDADWGGD